MIKRNYAPAYPMGAVIETRTMMFYLGISLAIHLIVIGIMLYLPESRPRPRLGPGAITVSLVSLPGPPKAAPSPAPAAPPSSELQKASKSVAIPKKETQKTPKAPVIETPPPKPPTVSPKTDKPVSLAPKKQKFKVKKSLKKKTQNRQKMIDQAMSSVQKSVENKQADSVRQAIDRLKKKVADSEASGSRQRQTTNDIQGASGSGTAGAGGTGGKRTIEITDLYKVEVAFQVERHWAFSRQAAGDGKTLQARIVFRVLPSGEITDIRFTQKSGNTYLDDSVYRAIVKANPVSPHPDGIRVPYVTVALRFTPEGMRK